MLKPSDLVCIPFTPDLTRSGIDYACRSLPYTYNRMGGSPFDRMRRIVSGIAVELAFRRHLAEEQVPFDTLGATPFTDRDRYDISLGGHRCDLKSFLITHKSHISQVHASPALLLQAPALVPEDQFGAPGHADTDLYVFAFATGLVASSAAATVAAVKAAQPVYLIHVMPEQWVHPEPWAPLGELVLKSDASQPITLEIGGQDASRQFIARTLELEPRTRTAVGDGFHSLAYLHAASQTPARLGIHASTRHGTYLVDSAGWGNIWVYGLRIFLAGWIARDDFRAASQMVAKGSRVFQYDHTRTRNLAVPVSDLRPLPELLARARAWAPSSSNAAR